MQSMNWDDLRILDACARAGSFSKAAAELDMNHSSISRRIKQLETDLGFVLFNRLSSGIQLTSSGFALTQKAKDMAAIALEVKNISGGDRSELAGTLTFQTVDATGYNLMGYLKEFSILYPKIQVELILSQDFANLARGEADVVLRATNTPPETYIGRRVAQHSFGVFCASELFNSFTNSTSLSEMPWVVWQSGLSDPWMKKHVPNAQIVMKVNTAYAITQAVREGIGIAHLACYGVAHDEKLLCLRKPDPELSIQMWLLAHRNVRQNRIAQVFIKFLTDKIVADQNLINGQVGSPKHALGIPIF